VRGPVQRTTVGLKKDEGELKDNNLDLDEEDEDEDGGSSLAYMMGQHSSRGSSSGFEDSVASTATNFRMAKRKQQEGGEARPARDDITLDREDAKLHAQLQGDYGDERAEQLIATLGEPLLGRLEDVRAILGSFFTLKKMKILPCAAFIFTVKPSRIEQAQNLYGLEVLTRGHELQEEKYVHFSGGRKPAVFFAVSDPVKGCRMDDFNFAADRLKNVSGEDEDEGDDGVYEVTGCSTATSWTASASRRKAAAGREERADKHQLQSNLFDVESLINTTAKSQRDQSLSATRASLFILTPTTVPLRI